MKTQITEQEFVDKYTKRADEVKSLRDFKDIFNDIKKEELDYGTIVHACSMMMNAAFSLMNKSEQGGITGFQASCLMWPMIKKFAGTGESPLRVIVFDQMLYPQYEKAFSRILPRETFEYLQKKAGVILSEEKEMHVDVRAHLQSIVDGVVPFGYVLEDETVSESQDT